jgi:hypothetical protein
MSNTNNPQSPQPNTPPSPPNLDIPLYLPGNQNLPTSTYTAPTLPVNTPPPRKTPNFKRLWLLVTISWLVIAVVVLILLFAILPARNTPPNKNTQSHLQTPVPTSAPSPSPSPTTNVILNAQVSVLPDHFNVAGDCQTDNGYRCTLTLVASQGLSHAVAWSAASPNLATNYHPTSGVLEPGQQQQIILYIYTPCPFSGSFVFSIEGGTITVPLRC